MDIRTRIKKMISGEIDIDEYEKEYTNKVRKEQEEKISKSVKENNSNISVNLPTQNIFLPTASSRNNLKIPSYRQPSSNTTLSLPKAKLDTSVDFNDLELVTRKDLEARQEAEQINKDIERGDYTSSIAHVLNSFPEGIKSGVTGIANAGMIPLAGILQRYSDVGQKIGILKDNNIFDNAYNSILDASDYLTDNSSYRSKVGANINNEIVKTIGDVSYNVGQMIPSIAANAVAPGTGLVVTGLSAGGNSAQETINNDRSNLLQATLTGTAKGFVEAGTEKLTGGNIISKTGSLDNVVNKTISSKIKSNIGKEIANRGYQFVGEMAEEQISNNAGYVIDKLINNKDLPDAEQWWNDFSETNKVTFLTTLALSMVGLGGGSFSDNVDTTQYTSQELQEADKWFNEAKKIIEQENRAQNSNIETTNQLPTARNNQQIDETALPVENEQYRYNNRNYEESAKRYGIDINNETVKAINRVAQNRGINVTYNADLFNDTNTNAIWRNNADGTREIILNPNADTNKTLQNVITHELTHDLEGTTEYNELRDLILNYNENKADYAEARKSLEELYSKVYDRNSTEFETLVDNEVVADILGNKLGNQEFVNNLTTEKPTLGRRIYNWVVDKLNKLNKLTGYKSEKIFWTDIKNKFENAYKKENTNNDNKNLYSIAGEKGMRNLVKSNPSNNITLEQLYNRAKQLQRNGLSNEEIRQQTNWFQDKNGDWKFEFSDKDMTLKNNIKLEAGKKYRLGDILEHDTLFTAYPELADYNVKIGAISKANASFNENTKTITLNKEVMQNKKMIEGTLIHEIQHAIQHIENFESGSSSRKSKLTYYNSLGEIEAADTKDRFLNEKYNNKEVTNIAPESSKQNPRHKNLNSYLQKRGIIDKIKDNIYNPSKGSGINHEINQENIPTNKRRNSALVDGRKLERYVENENSNKSSFSMEESENNSSNTELSEEAKRQLHRYVGLDEESLNKAFSEVIDNKENMLQELNSIRKKYKEFQNTDKFKNALEEFSKNDSVSQEVQDIMDKASKYADKIRYYQNAYNTYHAQQEAINSILMGNETNTRSDQDIVKEAEKHFGVTTNFKETAYIDTNGKQIDFSGKHEGGPSGERTLDHRQINEIDIDMESFINMGNIRILPEGGGINLKIEPNSKQYSKLREYIDSVDGEIYIDIDKTNNSYDNAEYVKGTPSNKIINDLKYYFKNGEFPKQSELAKFRYSITKKNTWQLYLDKNYKSTGTGQTIQEVKKAPTASDNVLETSKYTQEQEKQKNEEAEEDKIAQILEQPPEKVKEKDRKWAILKANLVDKGIVFEELSHKTKNRELQGKWDYTLTANARGQNAIGQARYEMNPKNKTEKQISKSLEDIRTEVGNKVSDFQQYMYHQLNIDRMTLEERFSGDTGINYERKNTIKNKPVFGKNVTAEISRKIVKDYEKRYPQFKEWAKDVYDFNNANKQELVKSGVISQDLADRLGEMYPHYIPIKRVDAKGNAIKVPLDTNRTGINSPLARAKGGNSDIQPLFQTMADRTLQTYRASARNNFGVELMNTLNTIQNIQKTDVDTILEEIGDTESNVQLLKEGKNGENPTFTVFNNGEKVTFEITKDMYDALKPINDSSILSKTFKTPNKISNFRRGVLTEYNPLFLVTNAVKDAQDVLINSQHALKTYSKFPEAYAQILTKGYWYKEYIRSGGEQNSYFKDGNFESDRKVNKAKKAITIPLEKISNINNVIEMAPRLAEYIASREKGASVETAMLDAARVTTNFKAGGDVVKFVNRNGGTFLNASVQGAAQQVRNVVEAHTKGLKGYAVLATKYAIAGIPALILNNLIWDDDEDYNELQDYVKDNYYIIGKYGDGKFIRIPKGRTVSVIQKIVNNISEYVSKDKEINIDNLAKDFWEDLSFASDNLAPNSPIDNNVISPIIQAITNTSWYGEDIVPSRLQDKPKAEQYDETIDSFSIWLGEKLNQSPYKINYLLDQYGGGISDIVLPALTKQAENNMIEDKFTTDSVIKSKYPGDFYTKLDELTVKNNSDKATDEDKIKYKYFSSKSKEMSDLYKEKREIQSSDLSDEEKKKQIRTIQNKINQIAKTGLEQVDNLKISNNTAQIGTEQYYKDGEGKWNVLDAEEEKKNSNISTSTYADYKQKVYTQTQQKKQSGELKENQSLKDKDKIQILIDSNYSDKEKQALYENYILSGSDTAYSIIKETFTNNGLNINKYLKYKTQEFTSDKKDDGTLNGKTVSGSKKEKVYQYVNNMDITYTQKLLLLGMEYTLSDNEQKTLVNYINSLDLTANKKLTIYSKIKGITVYKDGTIEW